MEDFLDQSGMPQTVAATAPEFASVSDIRAYLAARIRSIVSGTQWTPEEMSAKCAVSPEHVDHLLQGPTRTLSVDLLVGILGSLGYQARMTIV